jgi:hypothetical protein
MLGIESRPVVGSGDGMIPVKVSQKESKGE